jgi:ubiquinone/menaquinone biosynthesis C-methylase UbiE
MCPFCGSMERHRLVYLYLKDRTIFFSKGIKLFHIAPEDVFLKKFTSKKNIKYYTGDLNSSKAAIKMDITNIPIKNGIFDVILCCHVLEHIIDDQKAMREMFRILKDKGWALLQHPIDQNRADTYEDPNKVTPEEREMAFLQTDHVRIYGTDFKKRLENAGFTVKLENYIKQINESLVIECGLKKDDLIYLCYKPEKVN